MSLLTKINDNGGNFTIAEVIQQPNVWGAVLNNRSLYTNIREKLTLSKVRRVVFTGAGSSEYIGSSIYRYLNHVNRDFNFEFIATTDIIVNPHYYFNENEEVILVSFGRSGNSPESLQTIDVVTQVAKNVLHVIITCNKDSKIAKYDSEYKIILPDETHDKGFAMTSSFSTMMLAALCVFDSKGFENIKNIDIEKLSEGVETLELNNRKRYIYLGERDCFNIAQECALKLLELCAGDVISAHYSSLGFRHGPKSIIDDSTATIIFMDCNNLTRKYQVDLIREIASENRGNKVVVVDYMEDKQLAEITGLTYLNLDFEFETSIELNFLYLVWGQLLSLKLSVDFNVTPDDPCKDSVVNRVVQGVTLYNLKGDENEKA